MTHSRQLPFGLLMGVIIGAWLLLVAITTWWILADPSLRSSSDSDLHHINALFYARALTHGSLSDLATVLKEGPPTWPPLTYLLHGTLGGLVNDSDRAMRLYTLVLLPLFIWAVYRIGRHLGDRETATLAVLFSLFSLGLVAQLRHVSLDWPATVTVTLAMAALLEARHRRGPLPILLFGAACGLALFTRVQALFFLFAPAALVFGQRLWRAPNQRSRGMLLLALAGALGLMALVSAPYWAGRLAALVNEGLAHTDTSKVPSNEAASFLGGLLLYGHALAGITHPALLLVALLTLPRLLRRRGVAAGKPDGAAPRDLALLWAWILGGILFLVISVCRESRYLLPAVPALALAASLGLSRLPRRRARPLALGLLLLMILHGGVASIGVGGPDTQRLLREYLGPGYIRQPNADGEQARQQIIAAVLPTIKKRGCAADPSACLLLFFGLHDMELIAQLVPRVPGLFNLRFFDHYTFTPLLQKALYRRKVLLISIGKEQPYRLLFQRPYCERSFSLYRVPRRQNPWLSEHSRGLYGSRAPQR